MENREVSDSIPTDSVLDNYTYHHFLDYMTKYAWAWYDWGNDTYTPDPDDPNLPPQVRARFPNKTFLEVINFDEIPVGNDMRADASIDPDLKNSNPHPKYLDRINKD